MSTIALPPYVTDLAETVRHALAEDVGSGDHTAQLVPADERAEARVISREAVTICGRPWVDEVFRQLDPAVEIRGQVEEGAQVQPGQVLYTLRGPARPLLSAAWIIERSVTRRCTPTPGRRCAACSSIWAWTPPMR